MESPSLLKNCHLVIALYQTLATFVIEQDDVVCFVGLVVGDYAGTALAECLNDFGGLRTRSAGAVGGEGSVGAAGVAGHLPGLAVGDEDSRPLAARGLRPLMESATGISREKEK
jgi:hypothetical protein